MVVNKVLIHSGMFKTSNVGNAKTGHHIERGHRIALPNVYQFCTQDIQKIREILFSIGSPFLIKILKFPPFMLLLGNFIPPLK